MIFSSAPLVSLAQATPHQQVRLGQGGQAQPQEIVEGQAEDLGGHGYQGPSAFLRGWRTNSPSGPPAPPSDQPHSQAPEDNSMQSQPLAGLRSSPQWSPWCPQGQSHGSETQSSCLMQNLTKHSEEFLVNCQPQVEEARVEVGQEWGSGNQSSLWPHHQRLEGERAWLTVTVVEILSDRDKEISQDKCYFLYPCCERLEQ